MSSPSTLEAAAQETVASRTAISAATPTAPQHKPAQTRWDARTAIALGVMLVLWASAFPAIRASLRAYSPEHVALLRYLVASATLIVPAIWLRWPLPSRRDLPAIALAGFLGFTVYNIALNRGEVVVESGTASFLVNTAPVFTVILATMFLSERLSVVGWMGVAISFSGATMLAMAQGRGLQIVPEAALILLAALSSSATTILQKRLLQTYGPLPLLAYMMWAGTLFLLVFSSGLTGAVRAAPREATGAIIYMGVFSAAIGYAIWSWLLARIALPVAVSFIYLIPVLATGIAWLWLGEVPAPRALLGGGIALLGVVVVNVWGSRRVYKLG